MAYLASPGHDLGEENQDMDWESDERQTDPLLDERWSSATLKILSSMPSRTIGGSCRRPVKKHWCWERTGYIEWKTILSDFHHIYIERL